MTFLKLLHWEEIYNKIFPEVTKKTCPGAVLLYPDEVKCQKKKLFVVVS